MLLFTVLIVPLVAAALAFLLRNWPRAAAIFGAAMTVVGALVLLAAAPASGEETLRWQPLGRTLYLDAGLRDIFLLLYGGSTILLLLASQWPQGRDFTPALLAVLSPLALALMIRPFMYGIVVLLGAAVIQVMLIQAGRAGSTLAATRYLVVMVLALPTFLIAGWMLDTEQFIFLPTIWRLLLAGLALLLGGVPFHFWIRPLLEEAAPLAAVFVLGLAQLVLVVFAAALLRENPVLQQTALFAWLRWLGVVTIVLAGLLALVAKDLEQALAYTVLLDMGTVIAMLGIGTGGLNVALFLLLLRTMGLALVMVGTSQVQREAGEFRVSTSLLLGYGAFSLLGVPLTPGFAGRWAAVALLGQSSPWFAIVLLLALAATAAGLWRTLPRPNLAERPLSGQTWSPRQLITAALLLATVLLSFFPDWLLAMSTTIAALLSSTV